MSTNRCHHQATQSTSFQQVTICASEIKINFETLTGFTCSAVYDTATSTTLPPVSSPSPVDGGTPTPIVQECTTISVLPQVPPSADATTLPFRLLRTSLRYQFLFRSSLFPKIRTKSSATSTPRRTRFFHRAPTLATTVLLRRAPASALSRR